MGIVAFRAFPVDQRSMLACCGFQPLLHIRVAGEADRILLPGKHPGIVGTVWVVTGKAVPLHKRLMVGAAGLLLHHFPMARFAQFGSGRPDQFLLVASMRGVARHAITKLDRLMGEVRPELRFQVSMAAIADIVSPVF